MTADLIYDAHLDAPVTAVHMTGDLYTGDSMAHRVSVRCKRNGAPVCVTGRAAGYFQRADGVTVPLQGTASGNTVSVTLTDHCTAVPGRFLLVIRVTDAGEILTVFALSGNVRAAVTDSMADTGSVVPSLDSLLAQIDRMESAAANVELALEVLDGAASDAEQAASLASSASRQAAEAAAEANAAARRANTAASQIELDSTVASVNGQTGTVVLGAADVSAIPVPSGGTAGQVLTLTANGICWQDAPKVNVASRFEKRSYTVTGTSLDNGSTQTISANVSVSGYKVLGVISWRLNFSGASSVNCYGISCSDSSFTGRIRNNGANAVTPVFDIVVLYCKEG